MSVQFPRLFTAANTGGDCPWRRLLKVAKIVVLAAVACCSAATFATAMCTPLGATVDASGGGISIHTTKVSTKTEWGKKYCAIAAAIRADCLADMAAGNNISDACVVAGEFAVASASLIN